MPKIIIKNLSVANHYYGDSKKTLDALQGITTTLLELKTIMTQQADDLKREITETGEAVALIVNTLTHVAGVAANIQQQLNQVLATSTGLTNAEVGAMANTLDSVQSTIANAVAAANAMLNPPAPAPAEPPVPPVAPVDPQPAPPSEPTTPPDETPATPPADPAPADPAPAPTEQPAQPQG